MRKERCRKQLHCHYRRIYLVVTTAIATGQGAILSDAGSRRVQQSSGNVQAG